jgi:hypothetical protein
MFTQGTLGQIIGALVEYPESEGSVLALPNAGDSSTDLRALPNRGDHNINGIVAHCRWVFQAAGDAEQHCGLLSDFDR